MKKIILFCLVILMAAASLPFLPGCGDVVAGSGETQTIELNYANFSRLEITAGFNMEISYGDTFFASITIDKALYEYINIAQRGDILHIGLKPNYTYTASARSGVIRLPDIRKLELSGGSGARLTGFTLTHNLDIVLSGASRLTLDPTQSGDTSFDLSGASTAEGTIEMNNGNIAMSGASTLKLAGTVKNLKINASGASKIEVKDVPAVTASVVLSGASRADITVSDTLDVKLSGASALGYTGNPKIGRLDISGGSKFNQSVP